MMIHQLQTSCIHLEVKVHKRLRQVPLQSILYEVRETFQTHYLQEEMNYISKYRSHERH